MEAQSQRPDAATWTIMAIWIAAAIVSIVLTVAGVFA